MQDFLKLPGNSNLSIPLDTQNANETTPGTSLSISYKADFGRIRKHSVSKEPTKIEDNENTNPATPQNRFLRKVLMKVESMRSSDSSRSGRAGSANSERSGRKRASSRTSITVVQEPEKKKKKPKKKIPKGLNSKNYDQLLSALDLVVTKQRDKKKLKKIVRRNSCVCTWCGKTSKKEKKWQNLVVSKEQVPQPEVLIPSARRSKLQKPTRRPSIFSQKGHSGSPSPGSNNEISHDSVDRTTRAAPQRLGGFQGKSPFSSFSRLTPTSPYRSEKVEAGGFSDAITGPEATEKKPTRRRNRSLFQTLQLQSHAHTPLVRSREQSPVTISNPVKTEVQFDPSPVSKFYFNFPNTAQTQPNLGKRHTLGGLQLNNFSKGSFYETDDKSLHHSITISQVPGRTSLVKLNNVKEYESVKPYLPVPSAGHLKKAKSISTQAPALKGIGESSQLPTLKKSKKERQSNVKLFLLKEKQDQDLIPLLTQKSDGVKSLALSRRTMISLSPVATMQKIKTQPNSPNRKRLVKTLFTSSSIGSRGDLMQEVIKSVATSPQDRVGSIKRIYNNNLSRVSQRKKDKF